VNQATLDITALAAGGDGIARLDGLVVFTPRTAPGDRVTAEVAVEGRVGRGRLQRVEVPGASRVAPVCAHYDAPDRCGGCQLQHVAIDAQRAAKQRIVRDAFARIARRDVPLPALEGGDPWRYRRTLTLAIRRHADGSRFAGLRAFDDPEAVFDLHDCPITDVRVLAAWRRILAAAAHLPDEDRLRGTVRWLGEQAGFVLEGGREWPALQEFLDAVPDLAAVWWQGAAKRRRLVADRRPAAVPGASFMQVNEALSARMHRDVVARVLVHRPDTVVDAYSGAGDTAAALAAAGVRVTAIELDEEASAWAAARLPAGSRAVAARVEDALPRVLPADVVILNPPRAGVDARVIRTLSTSRPVPRALVYVSCDPATLARDVARLEGWRVHALTCYDLFPQTAHVETVCELRPGPEDA
jgi:23S rRNA (uracil1939-C5)-methyltransferase